MTKAHIYKPDKNAMQSGKAKDFWLLEFEPDSGFFTENLMGWRGSADTTRQIRLCFPTKEEAIAYAEHHKLSYHVRLPHKRSAIIKSYAGNFAFDKRV